MTADVPGRKNITVYQGNDVAKTFMWGEPGARKIDDLVITSGSTVATSISARFTTADDDRKIVTQDGTGITDGTTMTYVSATEISLSDPATATATDVKAVVRGMNASAYSGHVAQIRRDEHAADVDAEFQVEDARKAVGVFVLTLANTVTDGMTRGGVWDWQVTGPNGVSTWVAGKVKFVKDVSRP